MTFRLLVGRNVPLEEFPGLFEMEGHTGFFGAAFTFLWFGASAYYFPNIRELGLMWWSAAGIGAAFLVLMQLSFILAGRFFRKISKADAAQINDVEFQVRKWIAFLTSSYVLVCCVLIWLTGGVASPFTLFYVMVFTLTIAKCKFPHPAALTFAYFTAALVAASFLAPKFLPSPIPNLDMTEIIVSDFHKSMHFTFLFASLLVPLLSAYYVHLKERERLKAV